VTGPPIFNDITALFDSLVSAVNDLGLLCWYMWGTPYKQTMKGTAVGFYKANVRTQNCGRDCHIKQRNVINWKTGIHFAHPVSYTVI